MLEAGVPLIVVKNFLGHVSLQTTQIYTEITQDTINKQLKSWNEKWFLKDNSHFENTNAKSNIPEFLREQVVIVIRDLKRRIADLR